jgi:Polyketide cyclase / dehydrase and lipid transport
MMMSVCPAAVVAAPIEKVWQMLTHTDTYDRWWDARTERIEPPGLASVGQTLYATSEELGRKWPVTLQIELVDDIKHQLRLKTTLPLGMTMVNHISCASVADGTATRVQFG